MGEKVVITHILIQMELQGCWACTAWSKISLQGLWFEAGELMGPKPTCIHPLLAQRKNCPATPSHAALGGRRGGISHSNTLLRTKPKPSTQFTNIQGFVQKWREDGENAAAQGPAKKAPSSRCHPCQQQPGRGSAPVAAVHPSPSASHSQACSCSSGLIRRRTCSVRRPRNFSSSSLMKA